MTEQDWLNSDDALLSELRAAGAGGTSEPDALTRAAYDVFTWRTVDEELGLLTLAFDSALTPAGFRGGDGDGRARMLVFENDELTVELQVGDDDVLMGQVVPARSAQTVLVEDTSGGVTQTQTDDSGFFLVRRVRSGPLRLRLTAPVALVTAWVTL
jgi:hypothetical protein